MASVIVKLNEGVSGAGQRARRPARRCPRPARRTSAPQILERLRRDAARVARTRRSTAYLAKLAERGGIVEERIAGDELRSPSVQLRVTARRRGRAAVDPRPAARRRRAGRATSAAAFPADSGYAPAISARGRRRSAQRLAREGVLGRFAIDFVVVRDADGEWTPYAIELNLRKGGTTHPFLTLQFLTDGRYDAATGAVPDPRRAREAPGRDRPPRVRRAPRR